MILGSKLKALRALIRWALHHDLVEELFDIIFEEARKDWIEDNAATRYFHLRTELDASAKRKDHYHGKHPHIDNRND